MTTGDARCCARSVSLIPADEQAGIPEPVDSPARLEALVAALEAVLGDCLDAHSQISQGCTTFAKVTIARIERRIRHLIASERRRAATGGNDEALRIGGAEGAS